MSYQTFFVLLAAFVLFLLCIGTIADTFTRSAAANAPLGEVESVSCEACEPSPELPPLPVLVPLLAARCEWAGEGKEN